MASSSRLTSRDIARLSGVSQTTVSRVLRDEPYVSDDLRERVLRTMKETGYVRNAAARTMRTRRSGSVGVVVGRITNPFYPQLVDALTTAIAAAGLRMTLWVDDEDQDPGALEAITEGLIDGVIFTTVTRNSRALRSSLRRRAPIVLLNRTIARLPVDSVISDNRGGAEKTVRHLADCGHRRIAMIGGSQDISTTRHREQGFRRGLAAAGIALDDDLCLRRGLDHGDGLAAVQELCRRRSRPTAVFCINDMVAFGAIEGAREIGIEIPAELSIVGFDDGEIAAWPSYELTCVRQSPSELAAAAVDLLLGRVHSEEELAPRRVILPTTLVVRGSTGPAPGVDHGPAVGLAN